ncbi:hypothetical protein ACFL1X_02285 [Candidatus Hydrogenedentota bacterium]
MKTLIILSLRRCMTFSSPFQPSKASPPAFFPPHTERVIPDDLRSLIKARLQRILPYWISKYATLNTIISVELHITPQYFCFNGPLKIATDGGFTSKDNANDAKEMGVLAFNLTMLAKLL